LVSSIPNTLATFAAAQEDRTRQVIRKQKEKEKKKRKKLRNKGFWGEILKNGVVGGSKKCGFIRLICF
jgi:hypothetical protein